MDSVALYKAKLAEIVSTEFTSLHFDIDSPAWEELNPLITQEVLDAAAAFGSTVTFCPDGAALQRRDPKTMARIEVEKAMPNRGFKTNCDFAAFRILTKDVSQIPRLVNEVCVNATRNKDIWHVRENKFGPDIVQYMYIYHVEAGFLAEYQIGHPFVALKFKHDSGVRDEKPGFIRLGGTIYDTVKVFLLEGKPVNFVEIWQAKFGKDSVPDQEWLDCF